MKDIVYIVFFQDSDGIEIIRKVCDSMKSANEWVSKNPIEQDPDYERDAFYFIDKYTIWKE